MLQFYSACSSLLVLAVFLTILKIEVMVCSFFRALYSLLLMRCLDSWLWSIGNGEAVPVDADSLTRELLDSYKCYMVDCGAEAFVWMGKNTSLTASKTVDAGMSLREFRSSAEWFTLGFSASLLSSAMPTPTIRLELNYREQTNSMHLIRLGLNFS
ncbi:uncharacterized protein [Henckelia pumila]|uniref:uncharacterized protein isoform X2 n=1 Tax=Henckelia pumila TaxID=405737 RepID=UPI003C6EA3F6